jgi:hypothetical protein
MSEQELSLDIPAVSRDSDGRLLQEPDAGAGSSDVFPDPSAETGGVRQEPLFETPAPCTPRVFLDGDVVPTLADIVLTPQESAEADRRWPDDEEKKRYLRMRQSVLARLKHSIVADPKTGRRLFGGPQPSNGGGYKMKTLGATLVHAVQDRQQEIVDAAFSPLARGNDPMDRHRAAMNLAKFEHEQRQQEILEDEYERKSAEEIKSEAVEMFLEMIRSGDLSLDDLEGREVVDAELVEDTEAA